MKRRSIALIAPLLCACTAPESPPALEQTHAELSAYDIYDNTVQNGFWGAAWAAAAQQSCSTVRYTTPACSFMVELLAWGGLQFGRETGFSTAGYTHVELALHPNDHFLGAFSVVLTRHSDGVELGSVTLTDALAVETYSNGFKRFRIPLSSLNPGGATALALEIRNTTEWSLRPIWVDEVRLIDENHVPPPPGCAFGDGFEAFAPGTWGYGSFGAWSTVYIDTVGIETYGSRVHFQRPTASTSPGETHANLVVTNQSFSGNLDFSVRLKTVAQLRTGSLPNNWEVAWVFFGYQRPEQTYYFVPKPVGWELGKSDDTKADPNGPECDWPSYVNCLYPGAQRYLATGSSPSFPVGQWHTVRIAQSGGTISVWVNGAAITTFTDTVNVLQNGKIGLYNEDAHVRFDDLCVQ